MSVATRLLTRLLESDDADPCVITFVAALIDPIVTGRHRSVFVERCGALIYHGLNGVPLGREDMVCGRPSGHAGGCKIARRRP